MFDALHDMGDPDGVAGTWCFAGERYVVSGEWSPRTFRRPDNDPGRDEG
jgi:hypothetical protein